jgi:hypothetical protein
LYTLSGIVPFLPFLPPFRINNLNVISTNQKFNSRRLHHIYPTDYKRVFVADIGLHSPPPYWFGEYAEWSWAPEERGIRIPALTELMRWSRLRIRDAVTLECARLVDNGSCSIRPKAHTRCAAGAPHHRSPQA